MLGDAGTPARIRSRTDDGRRFYIEFRNGYVTTFDSAQPLDIAPGDVVLLTTSAEDGPRMELAPREIWGDELTVGVVRIRADDVTVVDAHGRLARIPTNDADYTVGNTVEFGEVIGVVRVLQEEPIRLLDLPALDDLAIARFEFRPGDQSPSFHDFGGLEAVVERAKELIAIPLRKSAELDAIGARPIKGVLFTGDPGTGKTLLARIIAAEAEVTFYQISGPEIFSKWYGQSEELLRRIFEHAERADGAIVFFDEIDSVAARRGNESHEASKRVVAQLLTLMDGFSAASRVVVIAATNRPADIDPALRRPGRFDWEIHFPLPNLGDREAILRVWARQVAASSALPHALLAARTDGWSGADLAAIWTEAALLAAVDDRRAITSEDYTAGFERVRQQRLQKQANGQP